MTIDATNPYQPPTVQESRLPRSYAARTATLLIPPILAVVCTLVFWLGFAYYLSDEAVNSGNVMFFWSATLIVSLTVSTYLINRIWPQRLSAVSIGVGYVLFGIVFCFLEGDTSNGTDLVQASIVYGTLTAAPLIAFTLTWMLNRKRVAHSIQVNG